ncbi:MAG TPA: D-hexose-6-phosphate mutarotase [Candidatus Binatia bacterium]|nr:D-hexose-6-phosphate mutarotase [Candidatus Binatia bacterium]
MEAATAALNRRFEIPGTAQIVEGNGGLPKVRITSSEVVGEMYLHGAHVTSWKLAGQEEVLFLSSQSRWEPGHAIRGGVPICFPWFGGKADDPKAPAHGFVRTKTWQLEAIAQVGGGVTVSMFTESDESTKRWWPAEFRLVHRVTFGRELRLELVVTNTGKTSLRFEEALHSYHRVGNIEKTRVRGLDRLHYLDKTDRNENKTQQGEIAIVSETDRVYLNSQDPVEVEDPVLRRRTRVTKQNSLTTVVWNPWVQKARALSDLGDDEWMQMICIETSNVADFAVAVAPGEQHTMGAIVRVADS